MKLMLFILGASLSFCLAAKQIPTATLWNGVEMPVVSAGTWQYNASTAKTSCELAFAAGFNHVDTAHDYGNQIGVGECFKEAVSKVGRKQLFLTTKVPGCGFQGVGAGKECFNDTIKAFNEDLQQLGVSYVDLMLVHFPPKTGCNSMTCPEIQTQWKAMELMYSQNKARAIGVSNYCLSCFRCLNQTMVVKPAVNQIEYHVGMGADPEGLKTYLVAQNIQMQAYSPLGSGSKELLSGNLTTSIGKHYNKTGAQVALKWVIQSGVSLSTKSKTSKYLQEDIDLFDWVISDADMAALTASKRPVGLPSFMCLK